MNNIMQHKRGSTYGWSLGPEIVNFENYTCKNKDSILSCQKNTIRFEVGTGSKNVFPLMNATEKIYGQWLIVDGELPLDPSKTYQCQAKVEGPGLVEGAIFICRTPSDPPLMNYSLSSTSPSVSAEITGGPNWCVFAYWNSTGEKYEYGQGLECTLTLSFKECNGYEELAPGQLGIEYTNDGKVKLKAGMPGINKWNELPYIGGENTVVHNAEIDNMNPISSHGVANIVNAFSTQLEKIDTALDTIIAIQEELIGLITFTIGDVEYQAMSGMTWGEWVGSKYDTMPHHWRGEQVWDAEEMWCVYLNDYSRPVSGDETIVTGYAYLYD